MEVMDSQESNVNIVVVDGNNCGCNDIPSMLPCDSNQIEQLVSQHYLNMIERKKSENHTILAEGVLVDLPTINANEILFHNDQILCEKVVNDENQLKVINEITTDISAQVFSEVIATISDQYLQMIPDDHCSLMEKLRLSTNVCAAGKENDDACVIRGNMQQILQAQQILLDFLMENGDKKTQPVSTICMDTLRDHLPSISNVPVVKKCDKGVLCDIIKLDKLSHFALTHPRRARLSSLVLRQSLGLSAVSAVKEKYRSHRRVVKRNRRAITGCLESQVNLLSVNKDNTCTTKLVAQQITEPSSSSCDTPFVTEYETNLNRVADDIVVVNSVLQQIETLPPASILQTTSPEIDLQDSTSTAATTIMPVLSHSGGVINGDDGRKKTRRNYEELTPFKFFCKRCSFKTKRESHFLKHLVIHDKVKTLYNCDSCNFTTIRLSHLRRHEMSHSNTTLHCYQCTYKTDEMKLLSRHVKLKHKKEEDPPSPVQMLQCTQCPYKTTKPYHYTRHLRVHNGGVNKNSSRVYQCDQCTYKTNRKEHYIRHVNNVHSNKRPYLCDFCGKAFKRPDALKQHRMTHGGNDSRNIQFKCSVCQKKCRSQAHLSEHQAVHSNVRSFLCEICGASFKTRSVQRKHVVTIHKNPRAHPCEHCDKRFNTNYALRRHLRLHAAGVDDTTTANSAVITLGEAGEPKCSNISSILVDSVVAPQSLTQEQLVTDANSTVSFTTADHRHVLMSPSSTLSLTLQHPSTCPSSPTQLTLSSAHIDSSLPSSDTVASVTGGTTATLLTIQEPFEQQNSDVLRPPPSTFIQASEATTALLYLTANFSQF